MSLSYQRLLEIIEPLPKEQSDYVLAFLTSHDKKCEAKFMELEKERQQLETTRKKLDHKLTEKEKKEAKEAAKQAELEVVQDGYKEKLKKLENTLHRLQNALVAANGQRLVTKIDALKTLMEELLNQPNNREDDKRLKHLEGLLTKIEVWFDAQEQARKLLEFEYEDDRETIAPGDYGYYRQPGAVDN